MTRFQGAEAVGEVIDFMVPETRPTDRARDLLVRQARAVRGRATFELACHPAFDYGRVPHQVHLVNGVAATFTLEEGQSVDIELEWNGEVRPLAEGETEELFTRTSDFWQAWVSQSRYRGRWREMVRGGAHPGRPGQGSADDL